MLIRPSSPGRRLCLIVNLFERSAPVGPMLPRTRRCGGRLGLAREGAGARWTVNFMNFTPGGRRLAPPL